MPQGVSYEGIFGTEAETLELNVLSRSGAKADGARHLVLTGHYDVVPVGDTSRWSSA